MFEPHFFIKERFFSLIFIILHKNFKKHNFMDVNEKNKMLSEPGYEPIVIQNPSEFFIDNEDWNITPESFLYEHI